MNLFLKKPMLHGPAVRRLQEWLAQLGYECGMPDGIYGQDTCLAVIEFQKDRNLDADGIAGPQTIKTIHSILNGEHVPYPDDWSDIVFDRRGLHPRPRYYARQRAWSEINGVTLHQTGCNMPQAPDGWDRLNAHFGITKEGLLIQVNDCADMIWHAQSLSRSTIGIEIEGNYPGIEGDMRTLWKGGGEACTLNNRMLKALAVLYKIVDGLFKKNGIRWERIYAHRQAKNTRIADPGQEIWQAIAISWMNQSGATDGGSEFKRGTGRPIPEEWYPQYHRGYWETN